MLLTAQESAFVDCLNWNYESTMSELDVHTAVAQVYAFWYSELYPDADESEIQSYAFNMTNKLYPDMARLVYGMTMNGELMDYCASLHYDHIPLLPLYCIPSRVVALLPDDMQRQCVIMSDMATLFPTITRMAFGKH